MTAETIAKTTAKTTGAMGRRPDLARAMAVSRIGVGVALAVAPGILLRPWVGAGEARRAPVRMLARSVGGRDIALGVGTLLALRHDAPVRGWLEAGVLSDAGDAVGILLAGGGIPLFGRVAGMGAALAAAVAGRRAVSALGAPEVPSTRGGPPRRL